MKAHVILALALVILSCQFTYSQSSLESKYGEPMTLPDQGVALEDIEGVIAKPKESTTAYGLGLKVGVYLLLKDGTIYSRPDATPHDLDISKSRAKMPKRWGVWQKRGEAIAVKFKTDQLWKNIYRTVPATKDEALKGTYKTVGGFGRSKVHNNNTLQLYSDGRFRWSYFYRNDGKVIPRSSSKVITGSYNLSDYTITFNYDTGETERFIFAKYTKGNGIIVGAKSFYDFQHSSLKD